MNAASAKNKGIEVSSRGHLGPLTVNADVTYLDAVFESFTSTNPLRPALGELDLAGNFLPGAAKWAANLGAEVRLPRVYRGDISVRGDLNYIGKRFYTEFNDPILAERGVVRLNASMRYESEDNLWNATIWVKDITDKDICFKQDLAPRQY